MFRERERHELSGAKKSGRGDCGQMKDGREVICFVAKKRIERAKRDSGDGQWAMGKRKMIERRAADQHSGSAQSKQWYETVKIAWPGDKTIVTRQM